METKNLIIGAVCNFSKAVYKKSEQKMLLTVFPQMFFYAHFDVEMAKCEIIFHSVLQKRFYA